jgi:hypothetical protein
VIGSDRCQHMLLVMTVKRNCGQVLLILSQVSTRRLERFMELPETCSVIPVCSDSDQQPEAETAIQEVWSCQMVILKCLII